MKTVNNIDLIKTERLILRAFKAEDYNELYEYLSLEAVVKFEPYSVLSLEECIKEAKDRSRNFAFIAVTLAKNGKLIGNIYFEKSEPDYIDTYELGYVFNPKYGGLGYATEAAKAIVDYGFKELNAHRVIGMCNIKNDSSWKLLERLNMRREATRLSNMFFECDENGKGLWFDSYQYAILDREWKRD